MNRFLTVLSLIVICVIGLGFYVGYLHIGWDTTDGATRFTLTVNQKKIQEDETRAVEKVRGRE